MKRPWAWVFPVLLPLLMGVAAGLAVELWTEDPLAYLQGRASALLMLAGGLLSALVAVPVAAAAWSSRRIAAARAAQQADHHQFMRRLDHQVKNPVMILQAALENLSTMAPLSGEQRAVLDSTKPPMVRLRAMTRGLRYLGQLRQAPLERSAVNLAQVLNEATAMARDLPQAAGREIQVTAQQVPWPLTLSGNHELLMLAVFNLLDNAIKFSPPGTPIEVRAFEVERGRTVLIEVGDRGQGIAAEDVPHLGEELFRANVATTQPGSGLGLALVRTIVDQHGGRMAVHSREGEGTVVALSLPVEAPAEGLWQKLARALRRRR